MFLFLSRDWELKGKGVSFLPLTEVKVSKDPEQLGGWWLHYPKGSSQDGVSALGHKHCVAPQSREIAALWLLIWGIKGYTSEGKCHVVKW